MTWRVVAKLLIAAPLAVLLVHYGTELLAVDTCLDSGGVYDYAQAYCRTDAQTLPYTPYVARHGAFLTSLVVITLGGVAMLVLTRRKRAQ
jgi:hypothetical protein